MSFKSTQGLDRRLVNPLRFEIMSQWAPAGDFLGQGRDSTGCRFSARLPGPDLFHVLVIPGHE